MITETFDEFTRRQQREYLIAALKHTDWNIAAAARLAGLNRTFFHHLLKRYNVELPPNPKKYARRSAWYASMRSEIVASHTRVNSCPQD